MPNRILNITFICNNLLFMWIFVGCQEEWTACHFFLCVTYIDGFCQKTISTFMTVKYISFSDSTSTFCQYMYFSDGTRSMQYFSAGISTPLPVHIRVLICQYKYLPPYQNIYLLFCQYMYLSASFTYQALDKRIYMPLFCLERFSHFAFKNTVIIS